MRDIHIAVLSVLHLAAIVVLTTICVGIESHQQGECHMTHPYMS